ncbi:alpha/beta hydrolase [Achromobacter sp. GG226]|uniref:alpha/beta hydrolase n=1 Tax=Verticiella alkaliphila TaxID=2779529 RepID=UPI001C0ACCA0|nr:alpha/beta hydrolase [Verticiella sp. GG226]MBU4612197.1 alpha/beta hydrolase [Verticiella sp. GG226]
MADLYRGMDRETLDLAYNNSRAVPQVETLIASMLSRSEHAYANFTHERDLAYGDGARQRYDWFPGVTPDAPVLVFIHGGYWQSRCKEDFAFVVEGPLAAGFQVVLAEYTLAPEASMTRIVAEIGALLDQLARDGDGLGIGEAPLVLSGHSAGGHLAAVHRSHPRVTHALPISGLMDLEPIRLGTLNDPLDLSAGEVEHFSPQRRIGPGVPMVVAVGGAELAELVRHSHDYALACQAAGEAAEYLAVPGRNHFDVLDELAAPDGALVAAARRLLAGAAR